MLKIKQCDVCGKQFMPNTANQKFCSNKCRAKRKREQYQAFNAEQSEKALQEKRCEACGRTFRGKKPNHFCPKCIEEAKAKELEICRVRCPKCGKRWIEWRRYKVNRHMCKECKEKSLPPDANEDLPIQKCQYCGKLFKPYKREFINGQWVTAGRYTCSWYCSAKLYNMKL